MFVALLLAAATPSPAFDPLTFFAGETRGTGRLKVLFRARVPVTVRGTGRREGQDVLVLDQSVVEGNKPPRTRRWHLRRIAPGRYSGTLTDARGPVTGEIKGQHLLLGFTTRDGFRIRQVLTPAPDGRSLDNRLTVSRFGIVVARLTERIVKP